MSAWSTEGIRLQERKRKPYSALSPKYGKHSTINRIYFPNIETDIVYTFKFIINFGFSSGNANFSYYLSLLDENSKKIRCS